MMSHSDVRVRQITRVLMVVLPLLIIAGSIVAYSMSMSASNQPLPTQAGGSSATPEEIEIMISQGWKTLHFGAVVTPGEPGAYDDARVENPAVIRDGDTYLMYYSALSSSGEWCIAAAKSHDGLSWTKIGPVITAAMLVDAGYDVTGVWQPCVVKEGDLYYLFFAANLMQSWGKRRDTIFLATSYDGVNYDLVGPVLYPMRKGMEQAVWQPYVTKFGSKWLMYYIGNDYRTVPHTTRIFVAESSDLYEWTRLGMALQHALGEWDLRVFGLSAMVVDDVVWLAYSGERPLRSYAMSIGLAFSADGIEFYRSYHNPVLLKALEGEKARISDTSMMWEGGKLRIWYDGFDGQTVRIFYAELLPSPVNIRQVFIHRSVSYPNSITSDWICGLYDTIRIYFHATTTGWVWIEIWSEEDQEFIESWNFEYFESFYLGYCYYYYQPCKQEIYTLELAPVRAFRIVFVPDTSGTAEVSCWVVLS